MTGNPLTLGVAGLGTVGAGTLDLLARNADLLAPRAGRPIVVTAVSARDRTKDRGVDLSAVRWFDDPVAMARDTEIDAVVELIGGADGVARDLCGAALDAGKPVVTANKAMLAEHGTELARRAEAAGAPLLFEAAVAGGIPVIKALREGLAGDRADRVYGILNGTCNFILTAMQESVRAGGGREFAEVLAEAQRLGYAEADPSFDVDGVDAAHKLAILTGLAFGCAVDFGGVAVEGIRHVSALDIAFAEELGYRIKLLGIAEPVRDGDRVTGVFQRVHPAMVPKGAAIAHVDGVFNAVVTEADPVGQTVLVGRGAGAGPTASAVVADLVDLARGNAPPPFAVPADALASLPTVPMAEHVGAYYVRLMVRDVPGVIAAISAILRDHQVSLEALLQRGRAPGELVPVVMTTHETQERAMVAALGEIADLETVLETPRLIRIEPLA